MPRHIQNRPKTRSPHGSPVYTVYIGGYATEKQKAWLMRAGGSAKLRELIEAEMAAEAAARRQKRELARLRAQAAVISKAGRHQDDGGSPVFRAMVRDRM